MEELDLGWQIIEGKKPVLMVAGHNFAQGRVGRMKYAEWGTGDMVRRLCDKYGFWGIVSTRKQLDPNWYIYSNFREKVKEMVRSKQIEVVVDIHGRSMTSPVLVEMIANNLFKEKYKIKTREFFNDNQTNLTEDLGELVPTVEVEIREDGRVPTIDEGKYMEAQKILNDFTEKLLGN